MVLTPTMERKLAERAIDLHRTIHKDESDRRKLHVFVRREDLRVIGLRDGHPNVDAMWRDCVPAGRFGHGITPMAIHAAVMEAAREAKGEK